MKALIRKCSGQENGQAMIFFAIVSSALFLTLGLAIYGGKIVVDFRRSQSAADLSALVGAQDLPGSESSAVQDACTYAFKNLGMSTTCSGGTATASNGEYTYTVTSTVPPNACSPYQFIDYGNGKTPNDSCSGTTSAGEHFYVETQIQQASNLPIPIFNMKVNLYAHAVARRGGGTSRDFAIAALDPQGCDLDMSGSKTGGTLLVVGSVVADSTDPGNNNGCSIKTGGTGPAQACDGSFYTVAPESNPGQLYTYTLAKAYFAPPSCASYDPSTKTTTLLSPGNGSDPVASFDPGVARIDDPYCSSYNPDTLSGVPVVDCRNAAPPAGSNLGTLATTCPTCMKTAWIYNWNPADKVTAAPTNSDPGGRQNGTWISAGPSKLTLNGSSNNAYELYPGLYPGAVQINAGGNGKTGAGNVYMNPGIYTIENGFSATGGRICVFGAPACDGGLATATGGTTYCANATFTGTGAISSDEWYYYCSPWGTWDTRTNVPCTSPDCPSTTPPTFTDGKTPLNGITFYMTGGTISLGGNSGGTTGENYLAFPNYCAGTGTTSKDANGNPTGVSFPAVFGVDGAASGDPNGQYVYPSSSLPYIDNNGATSSPKGEVYPSTDLTLAGECTPDYPAWPGEFGLPLTGSSTVPAQHLQFLVYSRNDNVPLSFGGTGNEMWWGILYNPGSAPLPTTTAGCGTSCKMTISGNSGANPTGPPMLIGQMIADNITFNGNATAVVFYRPCTDAQACGSGPGTSLVQ